MRKSLSILAILLIIFSSVEVYAESILKTLIAPDKYKNVKISPTGDFLALSRIERGETRLWIISTKTMKPINEIYFSKNDRIGLFYWANNKRLVIRIDAKIFTREATVTYGELYAIDADKQIGKMIFGNRTLWQKTHSLKEEKIQLVQKAMARSWATIIDLLPRDESHILISAKPYSKNKNKLGRLYKLNIYTGAISFVVEEPLVDSKIFTDVDGKPSLAIGRTSENKKVTYLYDESKQDWKKAASFSYGSSFLPLINQPNENSFIGLDDDEEKIKSLFKFNLLTGEKTKIFSDPKNDISWVSIDSNAEYIYGIRTEPGYPKYSFYDLSEEAQAFFKELTDAFKGYRVSISSETSNRKKVVFFLESDIDKGSWYLYDKDKKKLTKIVSKNSQINTAKMNQMHPFEYISRDGTQINGYITLPSKVLKPTEKKPPAVVLVHGGPYSTRDSWEFNNEVQILSSRGYAVLQVNYRGSYGLGRNFEKLGHKHWGDTMQFDILDGIDYAINNDLIDGERICIMGSSFGGYAALQSSILEPDKFRCAIAISGVYDLRMLFDEGDITERLWGNSYLKDILGTRVQVKSEFSPVNQVEKLKIPLFIVHGELDERAPIEQAEKLIDELDKFNKEYQWLELEGESHGISGAKNRTKFYNQLLKFLEEHNPTSEKNNG